MRTSPAVVAIDTPNQHGGLCAEEIMRTIVGLIENSGNGILETFAGAGTGNTGPAEQVLVDTEVDGFRYLLVRMARPTRSRIQLSPREQEIVRMVAKGHPNKVIADVLNISSWTVCTHLRRIFAKLGVGSRAAMVAQLIEANVIPSDQNLLSVNDDAANLEQLQRCLLVTFCSEQFRGRRKKGRRNVRQSFHLS